MTLERGAFRIPAKDWPIIMSNLPVVMGAATQLMRWIAPIEPRLNRATVLDNGSVKIEPFVTTRNSLPENYTLGEDPKWVTDRILALMLMPLPPPPLTIDGVGMRVSENIFWIVAPDGSDT